jgi:uncharacterized protein
VPATVRAIHQSPIKSLRLNVLEEADISELGVAGDREMILVEDDGRAATMRRFGNLALATARREPDGALTVRIDGDPPLTAVPERGDPVAIELWGRTIRTNEVRGPWATALSDLAGLPLRLLWVVEGDTALDDSPVSVLSQDSCAALDNVDGRRFRPTLLIEGTEPHEEDTWIGREVQAGEAVLRMKERDVRCSLTTRNPDTGVRDLDTLRMILARRGPIDGEVCFGVYADVTRAGRVRAGDPVTPI